MSAILSATSIRHATPIAINIQPAGTFADNNTEYGFYGSKTGEKLATAQVIADGAIQIAHSFQQTASPGETFNYYESGLGNGLTTASVIKAVLKATPETPISVTAKEFSGEHVLHSLDNFAELFEAQKDFCCAVTNSAATHAPSLTAENKPSKERITKVIELTGTTAEEFKAQFHAHESFITLAWETTQNEKGASVSANQATIIFKRADRDQNLKPLQTDDPQHRYHVGSIVHAWRLAAKDSLKANIIAPIARSLTPGLGKVFAIQASGGNSGETIVENIWNDSPFDNWDGIISATQENLGAQAPAFSFNEGPSIDLKTSDALTPKDALRLAVYAAQIPQKDVEAARQNGALNIVERILAQTDNALTFSNQTLIISC